MLLSKYKRIIPYNTHIQALPYVYTHIPIIANIGIGIQPSIIKTNLITQNRVIETKSAPDIKINDYDKYNLEDDDFSKYTQMQEAKLYTDLIVQGLIGITFFIMLILLTKSLFSGNNMGGPPGMNKFMNIGKTVDKNTLSVTFDDVAGLDQAKLELQEIIDFLKNPKKYSDIGAKIPTGCLLAGNPGLGKTLLAKAVAGEADVPFFAISASEFVELYVGVGALRIRNLFKKAKEQAPCIIFIDELDTIGKSRSTGGIQGSDERDQSINQLLTEMDGFDTNTGVVVIAATNRIDILDSALIRPGRFDRKIILELPNISAREAILNVHNRNKPFKKDVMMNIVARNTSGFSGADLANLLNESAIFAARRNDTSISNEDIDNALERIILGLEKKDIIISDEKKRIVAYHEAGHALVAYKIGDYDTIKKVSIIPRGGAGGITMFEHNESGLYKKEYLENQLAVALGGRVAETIILGSNVTTGAQSDLLRVQQLSRNMIVKYGFKENLGHIGWDDNEQHSEQLAYLIDNEIRLLSNYAYEKAKNIIVTNLDLLDKIANLLLEKETINEQDIIDVDVSKSIDLI